MSSVFDAATFTVLVKVFHANAPTFRTAWFLESIATQILVIFLIRTRGSLWKSRPNWILVATSLSALAGTIVMVLSPVRQLFGFVTISAPLGWAILAVMIGYLVCAEIAKRFAIVPLSTRRQRAAA